MSDLGALEELALLAVCILAEDAYGAEVQREIEEQSGRTISLGAAHKSLYRLEEQGLLSSEMGGATAERGGRRKRIFTVTGSGMRALRASRDTRRRMWSLIPAADTFTGRVAKSLAAGQIAPCPAGDNRTGSSS